jgi:hypothetical protein
MAKFWRRQVSTTEWDSGDPWPGFFTPVEALNAFTERRLSPQPGKPSSPVPLRTWPKGPPRPAPSAQGRAQRPVPPRCGVRRPRSIPAPATCHSLRGVHLPIATGGVGLYLNRGRRHFTAVTLQTGFEPRHLVGVKSHVPSSLHPIIYERWPLASVPVYHGRRHHVWLDMCRESRLDEHICLQVSRVGIPLDNVGKRGV